MDEDENKLPDRGVYQGNSMGDVFTDGDILLFSDVPFDDLECGDIVAVFERTPYYVHRIVKKENGGVITMGDNNRRPDALKLDQNSKIKFVKQSIPVENFATVLSVAGGSAGMKQFRRRQKQLWLKWRISDLLPLIRGLGCLRIPAKKETRFRDGTIQWNFGGIPVAARNPAGKTTYLGGWKRLFFRIPKRTDIASGRSDPPQDEKDR